MRKPFDIVTVLYGSETYFKNCPGYCKLHHKYLTVRQIKTKTCLGKRCAYLKRLEHGYWEFREKKKLQKKGN